MTLNSAPRLHRGLILALLAGPALVLPAAAHVTAGVTEARAGERIDIALTIEHGCAGQPTDTLRVAIPAGLEQIEPEPKTGWQVSASDSEIAWTGGSVPDHHHEKFALSAVVSADAPAQIVVPVVQGCGDAQLRWIDSNPGSDNPAPTIRILPAQ